MSGERSIFFGMQILAEQQWQKDQALVVEGGRIKALIAKSMVRHHLPAKQYEFPENHYLVPGFIDLHIHGAAGKDVMDATPEALFDMSKALAAEGITGFLPTTMSSSNEHLEQVLQVIANSCSDVEGAAIYGVHLEGPFIARDKKGAQKGDDIKLPDISLLNSWQAIAKGMIKIVTLAPELTGALELIKTLHEMEVIASVGHTNANYEETVKAINAGCSQATHLFNAMTGIHHRKPGAVTALLVAGGVMAEIIVDGEHLAPAIVDLILQVKGKENLLLVTDAMRAKCFGEGQFDLGGQEVSVIGNKAMLADGTLAGSTLCMHQAIKNVMDFAHCSLSDAIAMASFNPARVLKLNNRKGTISIGKDADLVVLDQNLDVKVTMRGGREVYNAQSKSNNKPCHASPGS